ncbi:phosphoglycerate mutase family protein [Neolewinella persica]|uniref:phosphoglycerate mutase family protein n=1 Tax=Neolewinella persica TaxID=70998 RepID=UPI00035E8381|nr:phosphoglycerate mutase family protein [Neolewinella persica]
MRLLKKLTLLLLFTGLFLTSCTTGKKTLEEKYGQDEVSTFILVRHAEKDFDRDPILTEKGTERAERLKEMLKNTSLDAIYSTDTRRTQLTAAPTAKELDLEVISYSPAELQLFAKELKRKFRGKTVLIVGHSNTTPAMANYLADTDKNPRFSELDYTNLYVVTIPTVGKARVLKLRF